MSRKVDDKFIVKLQGKEFILYNGLVHLAHQDGLISLDVELLQFPNKDNDMTAIAKAVAKTKDKTFSDIGDASPGSVTGMLKPHIIRMAATRAKARALRDLTNIGMTAAEEMIDEEDSPRQPTKQSKQPNNNSGDLKCSECDAKITDAIKTFSNKKYGKPLCLECQKKH